LVIFDCDGVLVDSEPTSNRVLASAITQAGLSMEPDEVALTFGSPPFPVSLTCFPS
jgi:beta-phosphoglucomutase-like phosphatase (HAD superfamily)